MLRNVDRERLLLETFQNLSRITIFIVYDNNIEKTQLVFGVISPLSCARNALERSCTHSVKDSVSCAMCEMVETF